MSGSRFGPLSDGGGAVLGLATSGDAASAQQKKPNVVVIWGDDIGVHNISAYNHGIMGYRTPNIDRNRPRRHDVHGRLRPARVCTAGRASFILGQHALPDRVLTIGMPAATTEFRLDADDR